MPVTSPSLPGPHPRGPSSPAAPTRRVLPALLTVVQVADHLRTSPRHVRRLMPCSRSAQVADHLGASTRHVRRLIARGELPVHRFGRLVRDQRGRPRAPDRGQPGKLTASVHACHLLTMT